MVFNSIEFLVFIIPVLLLYWVFFNRSGKNQNVFLIITSVFFYAWADWRFLALLIASTLVNFYLGLSIHKAEEDRKRNVFLYLGLIFNIGLLLYFKYFNFFYEGFYDLLNVFGSEANYSSLQILIPLGISFFSFQTLGYLIDVYNEEIEPSENLLEFSVFVTYFPKVLSGPIERAANFIPQLQKKRKLEYAVFVDGLRQILWGLFAKVVVAENCAEYVNDIFGRYNELPGSVLFIGVFLYAIQLYADFAGYSNMAIGISKLFGIQLMRNFATPFFSTNIADFWRKWHISLTTWMMDYVFTPLSFTLRRQQKLGLVLAIVTTFVLVGFWHGANWTFIVYGLLHGIYFIPIVYSKKTTITGSLTKKSLSSVKNICKMILLFLLIMLTAIFFRADNVNQAFLYLKRLFSLSILDSPSILFGNYAILTAGLIVVFIAVEWLNKDREHDFEISRYPLAIRWCSYITLFLLVLFFGRSAETFIYFQF